MVIFEPSGSGVKIIIAVGHSGFEVDKRIAKEVSEIDLVVGGHTNTFLFTGKSKSNDKPEGEYPYVVTQNGGKKVPVVQAFWCTKYLGHLKMTFSMDGKPTEWHGSPILMDHSFEQGNKVERVSRFSQVITKMGMS